MRKRDYDGLVTIGHNSGERTVQVTCDIDTRPDGFGGLELPDVMIRVEETDLLDLLGESVSVTIPGRRPFVASVVGTQRLVPSDDYPFEQ